MAMEQDLSNSMPDVIGAAQQIRRGEVSSETLVGNSLKQIKTHNTTLNAFGDVYDEQALEDARNCDRERQSGKCRGPLHGVPFGVKDLFSTAGLRTAKVRSPHWITYQKVTRRLLSG